MVMLITCHTLCGKQLRKFSVSLQTQKIYCLWLNLWKLFLDDFNLNFNYVNNRISVSQWQLKKQYQVLCNKRVLQWSVLFYRPCTFCYWNMKTINLIFEFKNLVNRECFAAEFKKNWQCSSAYSNASIFKLFENFPTTFYSVAVFVNLLDAFDFKMGYQSFAKDRNASSAEISPIDRSSNTSKWAGEEGRTKWWLNSRE